MAAFVDIDYYNHIYINPVDEKLPHILRMIWNKNMYIKIYIHFLQKRSCFTFRIC